VLLSKGEHGVLLERDQELERIGRCLGKARQGRGGAVVLEGPAGIGKTMLLAAGRDIAEGEGFRVLRARGAELERECLRASVAARVGLRLTPRLRRAWVTSMTHNLAIDVVRARLALPIDPADLPVVLAAMTDDPERVAIANVSAQGLRRGIAGLPVPQARALAMSGIYGMSARQVADTEGIPLGAAKTRIRDGMQKLRAVFLTQEADDVE
jgi:hypothetical protein